MSYKNEDKQREFQAKWCRAKRARLKAENPVEYEFFLRRKRQQNKKYRERMKMNGFEYKLERLGMVLMYKFKFHDLIVERVLDTWVVYHEQ